MNIIKEAAAAPLSLECVSRSYAVEVPTEAFLAVLRAEDGFSSMGNGDPGVDEALVTKLQNIGCSDVNYDAHFGACFYFAISAEDDTPELHAKIAQTIQEHLALAQS